MSNVFIAFQANEDSRPVIEAILEDNPGAVSNASPAMVRIDCEGQLVIRRESIEARVGRDFDLQEIQLNLITLTGHLDEDDDQLTLSWKQ
ncbi:phenol 2-monooxygenase P2 subunit [Solimonas aquatica]|uniref:Phenol 2-monooxygenase P2 subunit n=1 Tax=Solimonas aquatica TaxID=489703 RepID=A0A1H9BID1_9GAMM|nr:MmoB/DmpM family protein [Solimonas aquatica]SEP88665.1 phenol 2-monooxygenase P2 subunit [Solimonas aquatica]